MKKWIAILLLPLHLMGQTYKELDSLSLHMYVQGDWKELSELGKTLEDKGGPAIWRRISGAEYGLGNYSSAQIWAKKGLDQNPLDEFSRYYLAASLAAQGESEASRWVLGDEKRKITQLNLNVGLKMSGATEPQDLFAIGIGSQGFYGKNLTVDLGYSRLGQQYFWENSVQDQFRFIGRWQLNESISIMLPFQYANYRADLAGRTESDGLLYIADSGTFNQDFIQVQLLLKWHYGFWDARFGAGFYQSQSSSEYLSSEQVPGQPPLPLIMSSNNDLSEQYHIHGRIEYRLPILNEKLKLGADMQQIFYDGSSSVFNLRPSLTAGPFHNTYVYGEYLHKGNYFLANAEQGWIWNSTFTDQSRVLINFQHFLNENYEINLAYFYEWGTDQLYFDSPLEYNGFFLSFNYNF